MSQRLKCLQDMYIVDISFESLEENALGVSVIMRGSLGNEGTQRVIKDTILRAP